MPASLSSAEFSRHVVGSHAIVGRYDDGCNLCVVISALVGDTVRYFDCDEQYENWAEVSKEQAAALVAGRR